MIRVHRAHSLSLLFCLVASSATAAGVLVPEVDFSLLRVSNASGASASEPLLTAVLGLTLYDFHTVGVQVSATADLTPTPRVDGVFYSDVSLFYRYRFVGEPVHASRFATSPTYGAIRTQAMSPPNSVFGAPFNMDFGGRVFFSALRGSTAGTLDASLPRSFQGSALGLWFDRQIVFLRLHGALEGGYTLLQGNYSYGGITGALTYDRWARVAPGLRFRYEFLDGNGNQNALIAFGAVLYFKM
jgi:hypothetical protein